MTYSTLASIVKYPFASSAAGKKGKFGFFESERENYQRIADEMGIIRLSGPDEPLRYVRHPLVYLVEAADDICYEIMDLEDAHKLKILSFEETERPSLIEKESSAQAGTGPLWYTGSSSLFNAAALRKSAKYRNMSVDTLNQTVTPTSRASRKNAFSRWKWRMHTTAE